MRLILAIGRWLRSVNQPEKRGQNPEPPRLRARPRPSAPAPIVTASLAIACLAVSIPAVAQAPAAFETGFLVSYQLADLESPDPLTGFAAEVDFSFSGIPVSIVGHVSKTAPASFTGAGLRVTHDLGPLEVFGHYLFGSLKTGRRDRRGRPAPRRRGERPDPSGCSCGWEPTTTGRPSSPSSAGGALVNRMMRWFRSHLPERLQAISVPSAELREGHGRIPRRRGREDGRFAQAARGEGLLRRAQIEGEDAW